MKLRYLTLLFPLLFPLALQAQEEPSWWKAFESFKWIKEAPDDLFAAQGALQRKLCVVPSMNLVITRLGNQPKADFNNQFLKRLMAAAPH
jgi:hypothetical protein